MGVTNLRSRSENTWIIEDSLLERKVYDPPASIIGGPPTASRYSNDQT